MKFISSKENLKTIMLLLRDKSPAIQFEAFHVFKVFVANPKKPPEVRPSLYILCTRNTDTHWPPCPLFLSFLT